MTIGRKEDRTNEKKNKTSATDNSNEGKDITTPRTISNHNKNDKRPSDQDTRNEGKDKNTPKTSTNHTKNDKRTSDQDTRHPKTRAGKENKPPAPDNSDEGPKLTKTPISDKKGKRMTIGRKEDRPNEKKDKTSATDNRQLKTPTGKKNKPPATDNRNEGKDRTTPRTISNHSKIDKRTSDQDTRNEYRLKRLEDKDDSEWNTFVSQEDNFEMILAIVNFVIEHQDSLQKPKQIPDRIISNVLDVIKKCGKGASTPGLRKNKNTTTRQTKRKRHDLSEFKQTQRVSHSEAEHQKEGSSFQKPVKRTVPIKICFIFFSKYDNQHGTIGVECCLSAIVDERVNIRKKDGFMEHGRKYNEIVNDDTFRIVMEQRREQTETMQFNGRFKYVGFQTSDRSDLTAILKVYKSKKRGMQQIAAFKVIIQDKVQCQDKEDNYVSLSETDDAVNRGGRKKEIQSTDDATNIRASNMALEFSNRNVCKLRNRKARSPKTSRLKRKASSIYKRWDSHMSSSSTMYVSSTKKKRATHDCLQHTSFIFKRSKHPTGRILSQKSVENKDIPINTMERHCGVLPEAYKKVQHHSAPGIQVDYVRNDANIFEVYSYVRRRIDEAIELCRDDNSSLNFCSENIWIIFSDAQSTSGNNFCEAFTDIQRGSIESILDKDPSVIVSIGMNDQCFATLKQRSSDKLMSPVICKITPTTPTDNKCEYIHRNLWGVECFAKDLSKDNVVAYVDDVLEYYAFEVLDRATNNLPESGEITSRVVAQVQSFHDEYMPMPEILKRAKSRKEITKMELISKSVLDLPQVFACDISESTLRVMILKKDETAREEVTNKIKVMGLSDEEFFLQIVDIQPLAKFQSGSQVHVRGSRGTGTLGGFAKFTYNHIDTTHDVAITAKHVVDALGPLTLCVNNQTIGPVLEDEITYDIAITRVTADKSQYDTRFRKENKDLCFADLYHENIEALKNKAVHFYGATTGLVRANISDITIGTSFQNDYNLITIGKQNKSALAAPGDSGAMILLERNPRCPEKNIYALGTLVGECLPREEKGAQKSADISRAKLPVKNETENTVQLTKKTTFSGKPMHTENTKQFVSPSAHKISFQIAVHSEDQYQTTIPTHADDTRHPENPMTLEDPTNSENQLSTEDKMTSECSLPTNDGASRHGSIPLSKTHITYLIVPLKKAFDQLSKKHGGRFSLFTK